MTLNLRLPEHEELKPRIVVIGVGGAGGNAVNNMIEKRLEGADFVAANTDSQALQNSQAPRRIQLGVGTTQGLGAGARPEVGFDAAEESMAEIVDSLLGAHMCFITAGMGGGTG
ncbi:MAG: cell division protein FtsZ, partial [Pseudomonadota bacterium]